jgi:hypothetical protein
MLAKWEKKEYNKLEDTDYKMEEYVRVPKDEYERLKAYKELVESNFEIIEVSDLSAKRFIVERSIEAQSFKDKLDKIKSYLSMFDSDSDFKIDILQIIESDY